MTKDDIGKLVLIRPYNEDTFEGHPDCRLVALTGSGRAVVKLPLMSTPVIMDPGTQVVVIDTVGTTSLLDILGDKVCGLCTHDWADLYTWMNSAQEWIPICRACWHDARERGWTT